MKESEIYNYKSGPFFRHGIEGHFSSKVEKDTVGLPLMSHYHFVNRYEIKGTHSTLNTSVLNSSLMTVSVYGPLAF